MDTASFAVLDYTLLGGKSAEYLTANPLGGVQQQDAEPARRCAVQRHHRWQRRGQLTLQRPGGDVSVLLQAKDCASGSIFQMEVERTDGTSTVYIHVLGPNVFYFNNPRFSQPPPLPLCPAERPFTPACTPVPITPRVKMASDVAPQGICD